MRWDVHSRKFKITRREESRMNRKKTISILVLITLFISFFTNIIFIGPIHLAEALDITTYTDTNTTLNITVYNNEPQINWYDLQNSTGSSKLNVNERLDINEEYIFIINVTSDQGWADIEYINITSWFDNGNDASTYNQTAGGNINMYLQYDNSTEVASYNMLWPDDEVTKGAMTETVIDANTHNISLRFTPSYQVRYAPGDGAWNTSAGHNDLWTWNFNISIADDDGYNNSATSEYGVYMYSQITQTTESPSGTGTPGQNDITLNPHTNVTTRCNANYSLSTNLPNLTDGLGNYIQNSSISAQGGSLGRTNFPGNGPLYIYGGAASYRNHLVNTFEDTVEVIYWANITMGTIAGDYSSTVTYILNGES